LGGRFWCDSARRQGLQVNLHLFWEALSDIASAGDAGAQQTGKAAPCLVNGLLTMKQESPG
jgi:hypothetical protein